VRERGAQQRERVEARMPIEVLVFVEQKGIDEARSDSVERSPQPVLLITRQSQPQQASLRVEDRLRLRDARGERIARPVANGGERERREQRDAQKLA